MTVWGWRCLIAATVIQKSVTICSKAKQNTGSRWVLCELRSEWVGVNQRENLCLCDGNIGCVHAQHGDVHVCVCARNCILPSGTVKDVMQRLQNPFPDFFNKSVSSSLMHHSWVFHLSSTAAAATCSDSSSDDTEWNVCTARITDRISVFPALSSPYLDSSDFIALIFCCMFDFTRSYSNLISTVF